MGVQLAALAGDLVGGGNFSRRLNEIVERYTLILNMTTLPDFSDREMVALGELLINAELSRSKIKGLALDVEDLGNEFLSPEERQTLADKVRALTPAQIIKILEVLTDGD